MASAEKIRPNVTQTQESRRANESGLPEKASFGDIGAAGAGPELPTGTAGMFYNDPVKANVSGDGPLPSSNPTLDPFQAAASRNTFSNPNALGNPRGMSPAEKMLVEYNAALQAMRDEYKGTRVNTQPVLNRYYAAKEAMIVNGLMKGDL